MYFKRLFALFQLALLATTPVFANPPCWKTFTKLPPAPIPAIFSSMPEEFREQWVDEYTPHFREQNRLLDRAKSQRDDHVQALIRWGASIRTTEDALEPDRRTHTSFVLPRSPWTLLANIKKEVDARVKSGEIDASQAVYPAFVFLPKGASVFSEVDPVFVRIGIDEWPDPAKYRMATNREGFLSHATFYRGISRGAFPLFGQMDHELGHYTELVDHPKVMAKWREYGRWVVNNKAGLADGAHGGLLVDDASATRLSATEKRSMILAEALTLPDIGKKGEIAAALHNVFAGQPIPQDLSQLKAALAKMPPQELESRLKAFLDVSPSFTKHYGGTFRDSYNLPRHLQGTENYPFALVWQARRLPPKSGEFSQPSPEMKDDIAKAGRTTLPVEAMLLERLSEARQKNLPTPGEPVFGQDRHGLSGDEVRRIWDEKVVEIASRHLMQYVQAPQLGITVERVHEDARLQAPAASSPTGKYYRSFAPAGGYLAEAFGF